MTEGLLPELDFFRVRDIYNDRYNTHQVLKAALERKDTEDYVDLALGIGRDNASGNYSAAEHGLGPRILSESTPERVFNLACSFLECKSAEEVLTKIYSANMPYLKISVGTEMSMMLRPEIFWVTNVRTIWSHLLMRHHWDVDLANEELSLYRKQARDSEMHYDTWHDFHFIIKPFLLELANLGNTEAANQNVEPGELTYLWADAIADELYNEFAERLH